MAYELSYVCTKLYIMEKPISRQMHGAADYVYGPMILAAPMVAGFKDEEKAALITQIIGGGVIASTIMTKAEWGLVKVIPFKAHLALDVAVSLFTLAAPWLFGFANNAKARNTFLAMGTIGTVVTALTQAEEMDELDKLNRLI